MITSIVIESYKNEEGIGVHYRGRVFSEGGIIGDVTGITWHDVMNFCSQIITRYEYEKGRMNL